MGHGGFDLDFSAASLYIALHYVVNKNRQLLK